LGGGGGVTHAKEKGRKYNTHRKRKKQTLEDKTEGRPRKTRARQHYKQLKEQRENGQREGFKTTTQPGNQ